ncbi:MAG: MBL fold metallo-hydrolase [Thermobacillus sp. ZCTH02-B1]|nr:MAG: MBL fold metallo-hydrolase [Thermobacillus sp. ZCTH02-B1]
MLGTGNAFAKKYFNNNALLFSNGFTLLIDCGCTATLALHRIGMPLDAIDAILITHIHADHTGGLEEFAYRMKFQYGGVPVLYVPDALAEPLWDHSLRGGLEQERWRKLDDYFDVRRLREGVPTTLHDGLTVRLIRTEHIPGKRSYSLLFNECFFYTADMKFNPGLVTDLVRNRGCVVFHDCQFTSPGEVHASLDELLTLPEDVQENIWLMHYADNRELYEGRTGRMRFVEQHVRYTIANGRVEPSSSAT